MQNYQKLSLIILYIYYAMLLSSAGAVISQSILSFGLLKDAASYLDGYKDIPAVIVSFFAAGIAYRFGYKLVVIASLVLTSLACMLMPIFPSFTTVKILFIIVGVCFVFIKVSVYPIIGLITNDSKQHASLTSTVEGMFMVGVLIGAWVFAYFVDDIDQTSLKWLRVYWLLAVIGGISSLIWLLIRIPEYEKHEKTEAVNFYTATKGLLVYSFTIFFLLGAFVYVLIEQGLSTWLPTFNREILKADPSLAIEIGSLMAGASASGRILYGMIFRRINWFLPLIVSIFMAIALIITSVIWLPNVTNSISKWSQAPVQIYILPLVGFFIAPIYPTLNSVILSSLPKKQHASMSALIIVFSAIGSTTGSIIVGNVFQLIGGKFTYLVLIIPLTLLAAILTKLKQELQNQ